MRPRDLWDLDDARRILTRQFYVSNAATHYADVELLHGAIDQLDLANACPFPALALAHLRSAHQYLDQLAYPNAGTGRAVQLVSDVRESQPEYQP